MISSFFMVLLSAFLGWISLLPKYNLPSEMLDSVNSIINYTLMFEGIVPIRLIYYILSIIFLFELTLWCFRVLISIMNFIRGSGEIEI